MTATDPDAARAAIANAAAPHVVFDGWTQKTVEAAAADAGISAEEARRLMPRGPLDLAIAFHRLGDAELKTRLETEAEPDGLRYRDRIARAVRLRIEAIPDRETARRAAAFFALPVNAAHGSRLLWETADTIWTGLGDTSRDLNWYSKRAILSGVYSATFLYWLGDDSPDHADTWAFLDRRIDDVMQFEKFKAQVRKTPGLASLAAATERLFSGVRAPAARDDLPGRTDTGAQG